MWVRFKKRAAPGFSKYHYFPEYLSLCKKEVRRTRNQYGRGRETCPDRSLVCDTCYHKATLLKVKT